MYMSYCKFEGTRNELNACIADVEEHVNLEAKYPVSDREIRCFRDMVDQFFCFMDEMNLINEDGELDYEELDLLCKEMSTGATEEEE